MAGLFGTPVAGTGQRIGLLGGSFDPPHAGHIHISRWALKTFQLDFVWWLVTPGNPLKKRGPARIGRRLKACRELIRHPRILATDIETRLGTRFTFETLDSLTSLYPTQRFVWLMGADNLVQFHKWDRWQDIMTMMPVGVLARPGLQIDAGTSFAAQRFARFRLPASQAACLPFSAPPCWALLHGPMVHQSSSALRAEGKWQ